jgi:hypothetical protein
LAGFAFVPLTGLFSSIPIAHECGDGLGVGLGARGGANAFACGGLFNNHARSGIDWRPTGAACGRRESLTRLEINHWSFAAAAALLPAEPHPPLRSIGPRAPRTDFAPQFHQVRCRSELH